MALVTYPLNGVTYGAEDAETYLSTRTSGVFSAEDNFPISVTGQRQITIGTGLAWINNTKFAGKSVCNTADVSLPVAVADGAMGRIDRVVLRFDRDANESVLAIKAGTPASDPVPPDVERTELVYELGLYTILVPAASLTVELTDIASTMLDESVCGLMRDGVTGIPTDLLQQQTAELVEYLQNLAEGAASGSLLDGSVTTPKFASDAVAPFAASNLILSCLTTDTTHVLTGLNGAEGLLTCAFTADADFAEGNVFTVDGNEYAVKMQDGSDASSGLFVAGAKVQVLVDTEGQSVNFKSGGGYKVGDILPAAEVEVIRDANSPTKVAGTTYTSVEGAQFAYEFTGGSVFTFYENGGKMQATDANGETIWSLNDSNKYKCVLYIDDDYIYTSSEQAFDTMFTVSKIDRRNGAVLLSCKVPSQTGSNNGIYYYIRVTSYCDSKNFLWMYVQDARYSAGAYTYLHNYDRIIRIAKSDLTLTTVWTGTQKPSTEVSGMENGTLREFALVGGYRNSDNIVVLTNPSTSKPDADEYYGIAVYDSSFSPIQSISLESYAQHMRSRSVKYPWAGGFVSTDETMVFIGGGYGSGRQSLFSLTPLSLVQEMKLSSFVRFNPNVGRYMFYTTDASTAITTMIYTSYNLNGEVAWTHSQASASFGSNGTENNEGTKMFYYNSSSKKLESIVSPIIGYKIKEAE